MKLQLVMLLVKEKNLKNEWGTEEELNILLGDSVLMPKMYSFEEVRKLVKAAYERALDDNNILHGEEAEKFLEQVYNPPPMTDKQKKFLEECTNLFESRMEKKE